MEQELKVLEEQKVDKGLIEAVAEFRAEHKVDERVKNRIIKPDMAFFGKEVLEMGIATLLKGENLLLTGPKATGKNILRIWHGFSQDRFIIFPFMSIQTVEI